MRWLTPEGIQSNYSRGEILEVIQAAEIIASLSINTGLSSLGQRRKPANANFGGVRKTKS
jgi:hypothetical protein